MNDREAVEAINTELDAWLNLEQTAVDTLIRIAKISEKNREGADT